jgi:autotransporter strand-loop-strand O-heptosyltransferase
MSTHENSSKDLGTLDVSSIADKTIETKSMFLDPPLIPSQEGPEGIRYDFNYGCRVHVPTLPEGEAWRIRLSDTFTGNIIFESNIQGGVVESSKKFFIPFKLECWIGERQVFVHEIDLKGKEVLIQIPVGTLGDGIAWFPYADAFQKKHGCKLTCTISKPLKELFESKYPNINFCLLDGSVDQSKLYASYRMGLYFNDWECIHQPVDFRFVGLHKTAAHILGVDPIEQPPRITFATEIRQIEEPYVCIGVQSSTQCKYWNNPYGWLDLVKWLNSLGYRVLCIDKERASGQGAAWNYIPNGAEDFTGDLPLGERASLLKHADFYVGLSSGLAWLAWAAGTPVVMISGFTHPNNEFYTPYRVFNYHTCNSCWNDPKVMFDHQDFLWCPRHKGGDRQFECTRLITVDHVKQVIQTISALQKKLESH